MIDSQRSVHSPQMYTSPGPSTSGPTSVLLLRQNEQDAFRGIDVNSRPLPFPLDIAADAGLLIGNDRLAAQHGVESRAQVLAGNRHVVARPAVVELAAVDELLFAVEQEEVGRAGRLVA